jgi:hypothetical protein
VAKVRSLELEEAKHAAEVLMKNSTDYAMMVLKYEFQEFGEWSRNLEQLQEVFPT